MWRDLRERDHRNEPPRDHGVRFSAARPCRSVRSITGRRRGRASPREVSACLERSRAAHPHLADDGDEETSLMSAASRSSARVPSPASIAASIASNARVSSARLIVTVSSPFPSATAVAKPVAKRPSRASSRPRGSLGTVENKALRDTSKSLDAFESRPPRPVRSKKSLTGRLLARKPSQQTLVRLSSFLGRAAGRGSRRPRRASTRNATSRPAMRASSTAITPPPTGASERANAPRSRPFQRVRRA